jgi:gliding motility-associated-like protein
MKGLLLTLTAFICLSSSLVAQITPIGNVGSEPTAYTNGAPNDNIHIWCSPVLNAANGELLAQAPSGTGPFTFNWYIHNPVTSSWGFFTTEVGPQSLQAGLANGGYRVEIYDNGGVLVGCYIAWVWNMNTAVDVSQNIVDCDATTLQGTIDAASQFTYYNPPPPEAIIDANTEITVCFNAVHTWVSDLGFFLVGPPSCGSPTITLAPNPGSVGLGTVCNSGDNVNNLCFTTNSAAVFNVCTASTPLTGTYGAYATSGGSVPINWTPLIGCNAAEGGWAVQIYDCISLDVGALTGATITFSNLPSVCGSPTTITYASGAINSPINDNSCSPATASIFQVPVSPNLTTPIVLNATTTYEWTSNPTVTIPNATSSLSSTITDLPGGSTMFYLTATTTFNGISCQSIDSIAFVNTCCENPDFTVNFNVTPNTSCTGCNGAATINVSGETPPYTYLWSDGAAQTTPTATGLCPGQLEVTVTDDAGCTDIFTVTIPDNSGANLTATFDTEPNTSCLSCDYDGPSILINEINIWPATGDGSIFGQGPTGAGSGEGEWIELYNPNWCDSVDISGYILGSFNSNGTMLTQPFQSNGMAFVLPQGTVVPPLGFVIVRGQNATPPPAGVIDIVVNNVNNTICIDGGITTSRVWFQNTGGWFAFYDAQGVPQDVISWGSPVAGDLNGNPCIPPNNSLPVGFTQIPSYNQSGIGVNLGTAGASQTFVRIPDGGSWSATPSNEFFSYGTCNDPGNCLAQTGVVFCNGEATAAISGGLAPYTYSWNTIPVQTTQTAINLCAGEHQVTVTDANGCSQTFTVEVDEELFTIDVTTNNPTCTDDNGSISVTVDPTTGNYEFNWSANTGVTNTTTTQVNGLGAGTYTVAVSNSGCTLDSTIVLVAPDPITDLDISIINTLCGLSNGSINVDAVIGGTSPYQFALNGQSSGNQSQWNNLPSGTFTIDVEDVNGCEFELTNIMVGPSVGIDAATYTFVPATCSQADGSLEILQVQGGTPPFTYTLNGQTNSSGEFFDLTNGAYTLIVTDDNDCQLIQSTFVPMAPYSDKIIVPNVVTPNGDGSNDIWFIQADCVTDFDCVIVNRWGNEIYRYNDISGGWNGQTTGGNDVSEGVYFYKATITFVSGDVQEIHGHITVAR